MQYILTILFTLLLAFTANAGLNAIRLNQTPPQNPGGSIVVATSPTTTASIPPRFTHTLEAEFLGQGVCVKIKDVDGSDYTYLSTQDGKGTFSATTCE